MFLYVIRHAKATDYGQSSNGGERPLTERGVEQSQRVGNYLSRLDRKIDLVLSSPVLRAWQTAEIACREGGLDAPSQESWLQCGMAPEVAVHELSVYQDFENVAIVGHQPDLFYLLEYLLGASAPAHVKKASVTVVEVASLSQFGGRLIGQEHF